MRADTPLIGRVTVRPEMRNGQACVRGMRIAVKDVLECLASGMGEADILKEFPELDSEDIRASLLFAIECLPKPAPVA